MRRKNVGAIGYIMVILLVSGVITSAEAETLKGKCTLQRGRQNAIELTFGKTAVCTMWLHVEDFFGREIVSATAKIKNNGTQTTHMQVYLALFDAEGNLLGANSQSTSGEEGLAPGKEQGWGSGMIYLPPGTAEKVASYQLVYYEGPKPIGSK